MHTAVRTTHDAAMRSDRLWPFSCKGAPPTETYSLSLHDALPISRRCARRPTANKLSGSSPEIAGIAMARSEEHTSELQSRLHLVCRLLLEKKKNHPVRCSVAHLACRIPPAHRSRLRASSSCMGRS